MRLNSLHLQNFRQHLDTRIDFDSGRYAFCKIVGRPGEGQLRRHIGPTVPRADNRTRATRGARPRSLRAAPRAGARRS